MAEFSELIKQRKANVQSELNKIEGREPITDRVTGREPITDRVTGIAGQEIPPSEFTKLVQQRKLEKTIGKPPAKEDIIEDIPEEELDLIEPAGFFGTLKPSGEAIKESFTGEKRKTAETRALPEFRKAELSGFPKGRGIFDQLKLTAGLLSTFDDLGQMEIIKDVIPDAKFRKDEKGNIIVNVKGRESVLNQPGLSGQDIVRGLTNILAFAPVTKLASLGKTVLQKFGIGAISSGLTEQARQEISIAAGSEQPRQPLQTAIAAGIGGVGESLVPGVKAIGQRIAGRRLGTEIAEETAEAAAARITPEVTETAARVTPEVTEAAVTPEAAKTIEAEIAANIETAREAVKGIEKLTGERVPIFQPQQTLIPSELKLQQLMPQIDATSLKASKDLVRQNKSVSDSVTKAIESITDADVSLIPERVRTAAQKSIDSKKAIRSELSSPLFKEAKPQIVNVTDVGKLIDEEIKPFIGQSNIKNQLERIKSNIIRPVKERAIKERPEATIAELQKAKAVIDDILSSTGENKVSGDSRRIVKKIKDELLLAMDGAGTATKQEAIKVREQVRTLMDNVQKGIVVTEEEILSLPVYAQARIRFAQASPEVSKLTEGIIGKVSKMDDMQIETLADKIINPKVRPETIANTMKVLDAVDSGIRNDLLKFKMLDNIGKIKPPKAGSIENIASKIRQSFGNEPQRRALTAIMTEEQKKNFQFFDTMLDRASQGRALGSPTASFQEILKKVKSIPLMLQRILTLRASDLQKVGEQGLIDRRLIAISDTIFDDRWIDDMTRLRNMNPATAAAAKAYGGLIKRVEEAPKTTPQIGRLTIEEK